MKHSPYPARSPALRAGDTRFDTWLANQTGIEAGSIGPGALERAVLERIRAMQDTQAQEAAGIDPVDAYWQRLLHVAQEGQALIELLVVPETWFFRDRGAFAALTQLARERLAREPARVLRVLSAPCATGEEPYSIAMALFDAGIDAASFTIDALDISARALQIAEQAVYGRNAFRGGDLSFRERHFEARDNAWALHPNIRQTVRLMHANLLESGPAADGTRYDFIFCRNVLIYFGRDAQDRTVRVLESKLAEGGTLFVGPAETGLMMRHALSPARLPLAFAFRRKPAEETARPSSAPRNSHPVAAPVSPAKRAAPASAPPANPPLRVKAVPLARTSAPAPAPAAKRSDREPQAALEEARRLADAGRFDQAEQVAQTVLEHSAPHAEVYYLLGLIADARGLADAAREHYRRALYLEPAHYEALTHLAALLDVAGDPAGAQLLLRRAQRISPQTAAPGLGDSPVKRS